MVTKMRTTTIPRLYNTENNNKDHNHDIKHHLCAGRTGKLVTNHLQERQKRAEERERVKNLRVWEKTTWANDYAPTLIVVRMFSK